MASEGDTRKPLKRSPLEELDRFLVLKLESIHASLAAGESSLSGLHITYLLYLWCRVSAQLKGFHFCMYRKATVHTAKKNPYRKGTENKSFI